MELEYSPAIVCRWLTRQVIGKVSPLEFSILMFIYSRTYGWDKQSEVIKECHFLGGVTDLKDQTMVQVPLPIKRTTLYENLSRLKTRGFIRVEYKQTGSRYELTPGSQQSAQPDYAVRVAGLLRSAQPDGIVRPAVPPKSRNINNQKEQLDLNAPHGAAGDSVEGALSPLDKVKSIADAAQARTTSAREQRKSGSGLEAFEKTWVDLLRNFHPEMGVIPAWTKVDAANVKRALSTGLRNIDAKVFLGHVVEHWSDIIRDYFGKMPSPPRYPAILFVTKFLSSFYDAVQVITGQAPARVKRVAPLRVKGPTDERLDAADRTAREYAFENAQLKRKLAASEAARLAAPRLPPKRALANQREPIVLLDPKTIGLPDWE